MAKNDSPKATAPERYDIDALCLLMPALKTFVISNPAGRPTIDFTQPKAVRLLNTALMMQRYGVQYWDFPESALTPPVPGRAEYVDQIARLLSSNNGEAVPRGAQVHMMDVGTGASLIYPLIGAHTYGWSFVATDIDKDTVQSAATIAERNAFTQGLVEVRHQPNALNIFRGVLKTGELMDAVICNPPFHASAQEAAEGTQRKWKNLGKKTTQLNFSGAFHELITDGGEVGFIVRMMNESVFCPTQVMWFTALVSKADALKPLYAALRRIKPQEVRTIEMGIGAKTSRMLAWSFMTETQRNHWARQCWTKK